MKTFEKVLYFMVCGLFLLTSGCSADTIDTNTVADVTVADAPVRLAGDFKDFTLKDVNGKDVTLSQVVGAHKAVLINFWATWCPPCNEEIPDLIRLQNQFKDKGFTVLGVDIDESPSKVKKFMDKKKMNFPVVIDKGNVISEQYKVVGIPTSYLMDSTGKIIGTYHAAGEDLFSAVEKTLRA